MANIIKNKYSNTTATPGSLANGEIAYSNNSGNIFVGAEATVVKIGGSGDVTKLAAIEALADVTDTANVTLAFPLDDSTVLLFGNIDNTKKVRMDVGAITTATTRTLTVQDKDTTIAHDGDLVHITGTETVGGDKTFSNNIVVEGNFTVSGTTTTINTETLTIDDNIMVLNNNYIGSTPTEDGGFEVERGTLTNASLIWDESADYFAAGLAGAEVEISLSSHTHTGTYEPADATILKDADIGVTVQAYDATLLSIAALGTGAGKIMWTTGVDTWAETELTTAGKNLIAGGNASIQRTTLGVAIGSDVQAYNVNTATVKNNYTATAAPASGTDDITLGYTTGSNWYDETNDKAYVMLDNTDGSAVWIETTQAGGGDGEANTASNVGTAGVGVFKAKVVNDLQFKKLNAGSSKVTITDDVGNDEIDFDIVTANIVHDDLSGAVANEHIDHSTVSVTAGAGLSGGGTIATTKTIDVDINGLTADTATDGALDHVMTYDASAGALKKVSINDMLDGGLF